jgi:TolA-binding protein
LGGFLPRGNGQAIDEPNERREMTNDKSLRGRVTRQGEEAIGKVTQELLDNPVVTRALSATFEARERATRAQELAMSALNLPSAGDLERLTRRLRSVSQRLETIEDTIDRLEQRIDQLGSASAIETRLTAIQEALARIEAGMAAPAAVAAEAPRGRRTPQS